MRLVWLCMLTAVAVQPVVHLKTFLNHLNGLTFVVWLQASASSVAGVSATLMSTVQSSFPNGPVCGLGLAIPTQLTFSQK